MSELTKIAGIELDYTSNIELTARGDSTAIAQLKAMLTITNVAVQKRIAELSSSPPRNEWHAKALAKQLAELRASERITPWSENEDGTLSLPPGYWSLGVMTSDKYRSSIQPVTLGGERYYQEDIVSYLLKYKRSTAVAVTGSGKSIVIRNLVLSYVAAKKRVMVCVPSIELLEQTAKTIDNGLKQIGKPAAGRLGDGKQPKAGSEVVVSTIQSALHHIEQFDAVIIDETHGLSAPSYQALAASAVNTEYMHGLTATIDRPDGLTPLIAAWCGPVVYTYPYERAVADKFLSPVLYYPKTLSSNGWMKSLGNPIKEYIAVHSDPTFVAGVKKIVQKSLDAKRKTLVLFKSAECCDELAKQFGVKAASGEYRKPLHDFKAGKTQLLIGNTALLSTGIDCVDISAIIYVAAGTSSISFLQSIGRGTRLAPGKTNCVVVDITPDVPKYMMQQKKREGIAKSVGFTISGTNTVKSDDKT